MSSNPRATEAARLERDYLERLHLALAPLTPVEAEEIEENIAQHIHAAVDELETDEVSLSQMAAILEKLGPPESLLPDAPAKEAAPDPDPPRAWQTPPDPASDPAFAAPPTLAGDREFLDRLFVGYLIATVGLFIPILEIYFCSIIGYFVVFRSLRKAPTEEIRGGMTWARLVVIAAIAMFPCALLTLAHEMFGLLYLPVGIGWLVCDVILYWVLFGGLGNWLDSKGMAVLARETRDRRMYYIVATLLLFVLAIPLGLVVAQQRDPIVKALAPMALLPLGWVLNWFLILKPIRAIRDNLH